MSYIHFSVDSCQVYDCLIIKLSIFSLSFSSQILKDWVVPYLPLCTRWPLFFLVCRLSGCQVKSCTSVYTSLLFVILGKSYPVLNSKTVSQKRHIYIKLFICIYTYMYVWKWVVVSLNISLLPFLITTRNFRVKSCQNSQYFYSPCLPCISLASYIRPASREELVAIKMRR